MKKLLTLSLLMLSCLVYGQEREPARSIHKLVESVGAVEDKEASTTHDIKEVVNEGVLSLELKSMYSGYKSTTANVVNTDATALASTLKYELASYYGFNAAIAFATSQDIGALSGSDENHNSEMSSVDGSYTETVEAFVQYQYDGLNLRLGRQSIDTPLADSDDIRMIANTFEAYLATFNYQNIELMAGRLEQWQGTDAGLAGWLKTGEDGTHFIGITFSNEQIDTSAWYYNMSGFAENFYADIAYHTIFSDAMVLHTSAQYLQQTELAQSATASTIYGVVGEFFIHNFTLGIAYNKSIREPLKGSFSGFGGGTLYTNMDNFTLDVISYDRDVEATVAGLVYSIDNLHLLYAFGDFDGSADSIDKKEHIIEHNAGFEYQVNEKLTLASIFVKQEDKLHPVDSIYEWENVRLWIEYHY